MRLPIPDTPPAIEIPVSYRNLYEHAAFGQRELVGDDNLKSLARDRGLATWIGQEAPEAVDRRGALCPIAFADGGYFTGFAAPAIPVEDLTFRDEVDYEPWEAYAWDAYGHPQISPMYSPWQVLYLDVVARESQVELPIDVVQQGAAQLAEQLGPVQPLLAAQRDLLERTDVAWRPLIKLLVIAQNVYWPRVSGRTTVIAQGPPGMEFIDAGLTDEDPRALLEGAGCTIEEIQAAYYFLVERGLRREPEDGLVLLRRSVPRAYHVRWGGPPRQAQDHFDAAQMLYLWLTDLEQPPPHPDTWPMDGRQTERTALYERGPGTAIQSDELKRELVATELYPSGPIIAGEGISEGIIVEWLVQRLLYRRNAFEFYDLGGDGAAKRIPALITAFNPYAPHAFVIVDNEGRMARYAEQLVDGGKLPAEHLLLAADSLEGDNFTLEELIETVGAIGAEPREGREPATLVLAPDELCAEHQQRCDNARKDKPGIGKTLLDMARDPKRGGINLTKRELAEGLSRLLIREIDGATPDEFEAIKTKRPIVRFVADRVCPVLNRPRPLS